MYTRKTEDRGGDGHVVRPPTPDTWHQLGRQDALLLQAFVGKDETALLVQRPPQTLHIRRHIIAAARCGTMNGEVKRLRATVCRGQHQRQNHADQLIHQQRHRVASRDTAQ